MIDLACAAGGFLGQQLTNLTNIGWNAWSLKNSQQLNWANTAKAIEYQAKQARVDLEQNPAYARRGMENAGYNPLMVYGSNVPVSGASGSPGAVAGMQGLTDSPITEGFEGNKQKNQDKLTEAQIKTQNAMTSSTNAQADKTKAEVRILKQQIENYNNSVIRGKGFFDTARNLVNGNTSGTVKQFWNAVADVIKRTSGHFSMN